ncbi:MAG: DUF1801 domain-containing protein [Pseudomonadota bacterium]
MAKSENKTKPTKASVTDLIESVDHEVRKRDAKTLLKVMKKITGKRPKIWGSKIIGFGQYHYKYESGREGDFMRVGFSPGKANMTVYIVNGFSTYADQLARLGKYKTGKSCLYITNLDNVDLGVLEEIIEDSLEVMRERYGDD